MLFGPACRPGSGGGDSSREAEAYRLRLVNPPTPADPVLISGLAHVTSAEGRARFHMVNDLGLRSSGTSQADLLEVALANSEVRLVEGFAPGDFLYPCFTFGEATVRPADSAAEAPPVSTGRGASYAVLDRWDHGGYKISLSSGHNGIVHTPAARLVGFADLRGCAAFDRP